MENFDIIEHGSLTIRCKGENTGKLAKIIAAKVKNRPFIPTLTDVQQAHDSYSFRQDGNKLSASEYIKEFCKSNNLKGAT